MDGAVTIVTQTRVLEGFESDFAAWQEATKAVVAAFPGFIEQSITSPKPPAQVDWVILQRFTTSEAALAWLNSPQRQLRLVGIQHMLAGRDDVHLVTDPASGVLPSPVSAVISTRVKPGQETAYRGWELRIAAAQSRAPGFQGYRIEAPIAGVQEDWVSILRFDNEANLNNWLASPERAALLEQADTFIEEFHARVVHTGFDQWFQTPSGKAPPTWKQNMLVVLMLYPVVFLFGMLVQGPFLLGQASLPFPVALFIGNVVSVLLLNYLVPWVSRRFAWWLQPEDGSKTTLGIGILVGLYVTMIVVFTLLPPL